MNTCNGIDGGFTPTDGWLLMRERRTAAKGPALLRVLRNSPRAMPLPANSGPASDDALGSRAIQHKAHHATD